MSCIKEDAPFQNVKWSSKWVGNKQEVKVGHKFTTIGFSYSLNTAKDLGFQLFQ